MRKVSDRFSFLTTLIAFLRDDSDSDGGDNGEIYTAKVIKMSNDLILKGFTKDAQEALSKALETIRDQEEVEPLCLFKLHNALAYVENQMENIKSSLEHIEAAIKIAAKSSTDPVTWQTAEAYLNACQASTYLHRNNEALEYAELAIKNSEVTQMAIHQLMQDPGDQKLSKLDAMRMSQIEIQILTYLAKATPLEKLGHF